MDDKYVKCWNKYGNELIIWMIKNDKMFLENTNINKIN